MSRIIHRPLDVAGTEYCTTHVKETSSGITWHNASTRGSTCVLRVVSTAQITSKAFIQLYFSIGSTKCCKSLYFCSHSLVLTAANTFQSLHAGITNIRGRAQCQTIGCLKWHTTILNTSKYYTVLPRRLCPTKFCGLYIGSSQSAAQFSASNRWLTPLSASRLKVNQIGTKNPLSYTFPTTSQNAIRPNKFLINHQQIRSTRNSV